MSYDTVAVRYPGIGSKLVCVSCATRFYDLAKTPAVCPKCGAEQPPVAPRALPIRRGAVMRRPPPKPPVAAEADDDAVPMVESDDDEDEDAAEDEVDEIEDDPVLEEAPE